MLRTILLALALIGSVPAQELHVAAASDLQSALPAIAQQFEAQCHCKLVVSYGSSGNFFQQLQNSAPFDVFLSADTQHVDDLIARHAAEASSRAIYARGRLVLWAPTRPDIATLRDLARSDVHQVGSARPELAPYGAAAIEALKKTASTCNS